MKREVLKIGSIINIISTVILALVFITLTILSSKDISFESEESYGTTIKYDINADSVGFAFLIMIISTLIIFVLSLCNIFIKIKVINIIMSAILVVISIMSGVTILIYGFALFICCLYWMFLITPVLNSIGSILCLIGSCIQK